MKCPTCGRAAKKGQSICQFCGGMIAGLEPKIAAAKPDQFRPPVFPPVSKDKPLPPPTERAPERYAKQDAPVFDAPVFGEGEDSELAGAGSPAESGTESNSPSLPPRPAPPAWVRLVSPLFFILVFLASQLWLRDSNSPTDAPAPPSFREAGFTDSLPEGDTIRWPESLKSEFSLHDNRRVVFYSSWSGPDVPGEYSVDWHSPDGATRPSSQVIVQPPSAEGTFSVLAVLILEPSFPPGIWRVEVFQDRRLLTSSNFRLRE